MTDIKLGVEELVKMKSGKEGRGIVRFIRPSWFLPLIGVDLHPGQGKYSRTLIFYYFYLIYTCLMNANTFTNLEISKRLFIMLTINCNYVYIFFR